MYRARAQCHHRGTFAPTHCTTSKLSQGKVLYALLSAAAAAEGGAGEKSACNVAIRTVYFAQLRRKYSSLFFPLFLSYKDHRNSFFSFDEASFTFFLGYFGDSPNRIFILCTKIDNGLYLVTPCYNWIIFIGVEVKILNVKNHAIKAFKDNLFTSINSLCNITEIA